MYLQQLKRGLLNLPGWRTNRKIVVIESDDWGSIRMPSAEVYSYLKKAGLDVESGDSARYNRYDTLACTDDLSALYETLSGFRDSNNQPPVITAVSVVANPDFKKIKEANFEKYYFQPFTETLDIYAGREGVFQLWKEGIEQRLFIPQFHGREHLNVPVWMRALQENDAQTRFAFDLGMWGYNNTHPQGIMYQAAFSLSSNNEIEYHKKVMIEGTNLFEELLGYRATFFVPPNGQINNTLESIATENGIKYTANAKLQLESVGMGKFRKRFHYLGQNSKRGQTYLIRNCFFEPSNKEKDWVNSCLNEIDLAFKWKKPAIIGAHRVNFVGGINVKNREDGIKNLHQLLTGILKKWPEVEFMTSHELGNLISHNK